MVARQHQAILAGNGPQFVFRRRRVSSDYFQMFIFERIITGKRELTVGIDVNEPALGEADALEILRAVFDCSKFPELISEAPVDGSVFQVKVLFTSEDEASKWREYLQKRLEKATEVLHGFLDRCENRSKKK